MAGGTGTGGVYRTRDGGRTWEPITGVGSEWGGYGVETALVGRDGRLYVATYGGVWRTSEPLPVAAEAEPTEASGARLRVEPNPASGAVTIRLTLATPEAEVRVSVFDARPEWRWWPLAPEAQARTHSRWTQPLWRRACTWCARWWAARVLQTVGSR